MSMYKIIETVFVVKDFNKEPWGIIKVFKTRVMADNYCGSTPGLIVSEYDLE